MSDRDNTAPGEHVLHDATFAPGLTPHHFDPAWWRRHHAIEGTARGRGEVCFVRAPQGGRVWALRHYRRGGRMAGILGDRYFWTGLERTRPWREWRLLRHLEDRGLPVPQAIGAHVVREGLFYRGDLLTVRIEESTTMEDILKAHPLPAADWEAVGALLRRLQDAGVRHDDLNVRNILRDNSGAYHVIDFDKACLAAPGAWRQRNLARFQRSLLKQRRLNPRFAFADPDWMALLDGYG